MIGESQTTEPGDGVHAGGVIGKAPSIAMRTAAALAIADMIGIGVFTSLGFQVKDIPSGFVLIALWVVGGVVALCGALSYAELATAFPRSGGEYNFLSRIYGRAVGFLAGWISATVGFAAPVALAAMAFGQYFVGLVPEAPPLLMAVVLVWGVALVHMRGIELGSHFHDISTLLKVGADGAIDTQTVQAPIVGFALTNGGLMANLSIDGSKFSNIDF